MDVGIHMAHVFYGKNAPKSIEHVNSDVLLNLLAAKTNGFVDIPAALFKKWRSLRFIDVTDTYGRLKSSIREQRDGGAVPLLQWKNLNVERLIYRD
jgi:hypothetical protein